jgi:hypothetical protein
LHAQPAFHGEWATKSDIYQRVIDQIVAQLEQSFRPWFQPWNAEHAAGRITRPLRGNGVPYRGINVVMLWGEEWSIVSSRRGRCAKLPRPATELSVRTPSPDPAETLSL